MGKPTAKRRGEIKKRRRKRAERRDATAIVREAINEKMRDAEHPGWIHRPKSVWDEF